MVQYNLGTSGPKHQPENNRIPEGRNSFFFFGWGREREANIDKNTSKAMPIPLDSAP
jgi:hypothetical protein